ncbi:hypothetical protein GLE_0750 [Lysobacter enzymogenes]|uniref:Uncharacterized protein n=1 Tax=Lysobacter enzymogenes TaxID=69 RepID=A0A0S2DC60_LYSEN|nr:hypothetical protein GLE_0750 [Lysobacter enzymogenes]
MRGGRRRVLRPARQSRAAAVSPGAPAGPLWRYPRGDGAAGCPPARIRARSR